MNGLEPSVPISGGLGLLTAEVFVTIVLFIMLGRIGLALLGYLSFWASLTLLIFLRKEMGVRALSIKNIIAAILFIYIVGNMVGQNYHDMYRDVRATTWGARVHFTYLVAFIAMAIYRKVEAWQNIQTRKPSSWGIPSTLTRFLPTHWGFGSEAGFYCDVAMEPCAVVAIGLGLALLLNNWFGWYLILTGCLLFFTLLKSYREQWEAMLDQLDNPIEPPTEGGRQHEGLRKI